MEETFKLVKEKLSRLSFSRPLGGGVVLTGGGAQLLGTPDLAAHVFNMPVRVGVPLPVGGLVSDYRSPAYATAVGLVLEGYDRAQREGTVSLDGLRAAGRGRDKGGSRVRDKLKTWLEEFF